MKLTSIIAATLAPGAVFAAALPQGHHGGPGPVQTFSQFVQKALNKIHTEYPKASLYAVTGTPLSGIEFANNMATIQHLHVTFQDGVGGSGNIETDEEAGEFGAVQHYDQPIIGSRNIPWPVKIDGLEADQRLKKSGFTEGYSQVTLRFPLYPGINQAFYFFYLQSGKTVQVGAQDGKVKLVQ